jgi:hypothetical protein
MIGYHVNWSAPRKYEYQNWEILSQILSAELWKKNYGTIKLVCDEPALRVYEKLGITSLYKEIEMLDTSLLEGIDPSIYFAAGKLAAQLQVAEDECTFIDLDLILNPAEPVFDRKIPFALHRELPVDVYYPNETEWNWPIPLEKEIYAVNCGMLYLPSKELRREYASLALKFMANNSNPGKHDKNTLMVTAEQRLLGIFLKSKGMNPDYLIKDVYIPGEFEEETVWFSDALGSNVKQMEAHFSHIWGKKKLLVNSQIYAAEMVFNLLELCYEISEIDVDTVIHKLKQL